MDELSYFDVNERFRTIEDAVKTLSGGNKLNFLLYDGEYMYVHNNEDNSLYVKNGEKSAIFSTKPLDDGNWEPLPKNRLFVYHNGEIVYEGEEHSNTYISDPEKEKSIYLQFAGL